MAQDNVTTPADAAPPSTPCATRLGAGTPLRPERLAVADWMALAVSAGVLIAFRLHAFDLPLETDECNYAYIGARLLAGDRLYVDVWDHQPFGIFALFAAMIAMFGDAPEVFRGLAMVFSVGSLALLFLIVRRLSTTWIAACAALTFAVVSSDPGTAGEGCNREVFMNTFVLAAWWLTLRGGGSIRSLVLGGFLLGIGSTIKTVLAVHWLALAVWAIASASRTESASTTASNRWRRLFALSAGPAIIWGTSLMYFAATWRARDFLDAAFRFNLGYSGSSEGFFARFVRFFSPVQHPFLFDSAWPLWAWLVPTTAWLLWTWTTRRHRGAAPALLVLASYVATCLPGRFWPHYYYLMIPPAVIAGTLAAGDLARLARHWIARRNPPPVPAATILPLILPLLLVGTQYKHYLNQPPYGITAPRYNSRDFWARGQGERVKSVTRPTDTVFVFGHDTGIYYYANRKCASRYTMITGLQSGYSGVQARRETLLKELQERLPRVILVLFDEPPFAGWTEFLNRRYGPAVGVDYHDKTGKPIMAVFALAGDPIKSIDWDWDRKEVRGW